VQGPSQLLFYMTVFLLGDAIKIVLVAAGLLNLVTDRRNRKADLEVRRHREEIGVLPDLSRPDQPWERPNKTMKRRRRRPIRLENKSCVRESILSNLYLHSFATFKNYSIQLEKFTKIIGKFNSEKVLWDRPKYFKIFIGVAYNDSKWDCLFW